VYKVIHALGAPDHNHLLVTENRGGMLQELKVSMEGNNTLNLLVDTEKMRLQTVNFGGMRLKKIILPAADLIINSICDPDTNAKALHHLSDILSQSPLPLVNHPDDVFKTTREMTYKHLKEIDGLTVPKCVRFAPRHIADVPVYLKDVELEYPYIFRPAGEHGGGGMVLIRDEKELSSLEQFAFDGRDFYAIAFVDFRSDDGYYRKTRYIVIEGEVYFRHHVIAETWKIHAGSRDKLMGDGVRFREEEKRLLMSSTDPIAARCREMYEILGLDSFGIDCHIDKNGEMLVFEVNSCMNTGYGTADTPKYSKYEYLQQSADAIKSAFQTMLMHKLKRS